MEVKTKNFTGVTYQLNLVFTDKCLFAYKHFTLILQLKDGGQWTEVPRCTILSFSVFSCDLPEFSEHTANILILPRGKTSTLWFNTEFKEVTASLKLF